MDNNEIKRLKYLYQANELNPDDWKSLEHAIEAGFIDPLHLKDIDSIHSQLMASPSGHTPLFIKDQVTELIEKEKQSILHSKNQIKIEYIIRAALSAAALLAGIILGNIATIGKSNSSQSEISSLKKEMNELRGSMALALFQNEAPSERLKAVNYTYTMDEQSKTVKEALLLALNTDENINVRLATVDALQVYGDDPWIREQLVKSIALQKSPLVQVALAECMVSLKEKSSIKEIEKLIKDSETPDMIKVKLASYVKQI